MIFQEPLTRLNPLMRISEHFEETIRSTSRTCPRRSFGTGPWRCSG